MKGYLCSVSMGEVHTYISHRYVSSMAAIYEATNSNLKRILPHQTSLWPWPPTHDFQLETCLRHRTKAYRVQFTQKMVGGVPHKTGCSRRWKHSLEM